MTQIKKVNYGKDVVEPKLAIALNCILSNSNTIGVDLVDAKGVTYEVKYFSTGNRPSLTGLLVDFEKSLSENIDDRLFSNKYIVSFSLEEIEGFFQDYQVYEEIAYVVLGKRDFKRWIMKKTILDKSSKGKWQLRLNKYDRSKHQDKKMIDKGLIKYGSH